MIATQFIQVLINANNQRASWIMYPNRSRCFLVECHKVNQLVDMGSPGHNFSCSSRWKNNSKIEPCLKYIMNCSHKPQPSKIIIHETGILQTITGPPFVWQYHLPLFCLCVHHVSGIMSRHRSPCSYKCISDHNMWCVSYFGVLPSASASQ